MPSVRDRAISVLELLARNPPELPMAEVADRLDIPRAAVHRVLTDLKDAGYVQQGRSGGPYRLTAKIVTLAFAYLSGNGIPDAVQPVLDRLAERTGELARLAVVEGDALTWVAKAQGRQHRLRLDPDDGATVYLSATANGHAWLACLSDTEALELVARQGFRREGLGPHAPRTLAELLAALGEARRHGFATVAETYEPGTSAVAAPVVADDRVVATISLAGPALRFGKARMNEFGEILKEAAGEIALLSVGSPLFAKGRPSEVS